MGLADRLKAIEAQTPVSSNGVVQPSAPPMQQTPMQQTPIQYDTQQPTAPFMPQPTPIPSYNQQPSAPPMPVSQPIMPQYQQSMPVQQAPQKQGIMSSISNMFSNTPSQKQPQVYTQAGPYYQPVKLRVDAVILDKGLQHFYPVNSQQYNNLLMRLSNIDFPSIASKRRIPLELAFDFVAMGLYDIVIFADDSGSMNFDEHWGPSTEKIDDLKLIFSRIVELATLFDDDGISIRYFNNDKVFDNIKSEQEAEKTLTKVSFNGGTPVGKNIVTKVFEPYVYTKTQSNQFTKPVLVYVITDGEPDNKPELKQNILQCKNWLQQTPFGKSSVSIMFAQVGKDAKAAHYLKVELDNDPDIGNDVDATGNFEMEYVKYAAKGVQFSPEHWLLQMMLGAIDTNYDSGND